MAENKNSIGLVDQPADSDKHDHYHTIGVRRGASQQEILHGYRQARNRCHPDRNPGDATAKERFEEVENAWHVLGDAERKERYDRTGEWDKPQSDRSNMMIVSVIYPYLDAILQAMANKGEKVEPRDLIADLKEMIKSMIVNLSKQRDAAEKIHAQAIEASQRIIGDKDSTELIRGALKAIEGKWAREVRSAREKITGHHKALEYLETCGYRIDEIVMQSWSPHFGRPMTTASSWGW